MSSTSRIHDEAELRTGPLTPPRTRGKYRALLLVWSAFLLSVALFGWHKSTENERDRAAHAAWREKIDRLQAESQAESNRVREEVDRTWGQPGASQELTQWLRARQWERSNEDAFLPDELWIHPNLGLRLWLRYDGNGIVRRSGPSGAAELVAYHPPPFWNSKYSRAEIVREFVVALSQYLWLLTLFVALLVPRLRALAAHTMLASALLCGTAWLVAPHYALTFRGIVSNDSLFFAVVMLLVSITAVAHVAATDAARDGRVLRLHFRLRTLLVLMGLIAGLLAIRPFGVVALCVLAVGGVVYWLAWHFFSAASVARPTET